VRARSLTAAVVLLGKLPRPGRVKTRLCPPLTPAQAADLYRAFFADVVAVVEDVAAERPLERIFACDVRDPAELDEAKGAVPSTWRVLPQEQGDLGARIEAAQRLGPDAVVVLGTDSPLMSPRRILEALDVLAAQPARAAVLGPTLDGGYDLIATRGPEPALLRGVRWSSESVLADTRRQAAAHGVALVELAPAYDLDTYDDLVRAFADPALAGAPRTRAALTALFEGA
jgi:rSAM/selenodomain-associated transferase 1